MVVVKIVPVGEIIIFPFLVLLSLFMIQNEIAELKTWRYCIKYGAEVRGQIVDFKDGGPRSGRSPIFLFKYKGGIEKKAAFQKFDPLFIKLRFPKEMPIYYCEDYPDFVVMKGHGQHIQRTILILLFTGLLLFSAVMMLLLDFPWGLLTYSVVAAILFIYFWKRRKRKKLEDTDSGSAGKST